MTLLKTKYDLDILDNFAQFLYSEHHKANKYLCPKKVLEASLVVYLSFDIISFCPYDVTKDHPEFTFSVFLWPVYMRVT